MTSPRYEIVHKRIYNSDATAPLVIPILVLSNTSDEDLERNIRANSALSHEWVKMEPEHDGKAVIVGGGPSVKAYAQAILVMQKEGAKIFAINGASAWLRTNGVTPDYQVIADAKRETATLVDPEAKAHLFASQVDSETMSSVANPIIWQLGDECIEDYFPQERRKRGGYALIGGGAATGNSAMCLAYVMGFRDLHGFGLDSSHRGDASHAYDQPMNRWIPTVEVEWAGKTYTSSVAMKAQAEKFQMTSQALKQAGCKITVYGDGLLQHMYTTPPENLTERDKYRLMWQFDGYRALSPGECVVPLFLELVKPDGLVIDFGCGTGRAGLAIHDAGLPVLLVDFADNCRDQEALSLPFLEWDIARAMPPRAKYGLCTDVMEHIPGDSVEAVISNIMEAAQTVFFQISTVPDSFGQLIGQLLHLSVHPHDWWLDLFKSLGFVVANDIKSENASIFIVTRKSALAA
jgi:hypothetical protein